MHREKGASWANKLGGTAAERREVLETKHVPLQMCYFRRVVYDEVHEIDWETNQTCAGWTNYRHARDGLAPVWDGLAAARASQGA